MDGEGLALIWQKLISMAGLGGILTPSYLGDRRPWSWCCYTGLHDWWCTSYILTYRYSSHIQTSSPTPAPKHRSRCSEINIASRDPVGPSHLLRERRRWTSDTDTMRARALPGLFISRQETRHTSRPRSKYWNTDWRTHATESSHGQRHNIICTFLLCDTVTKIAFWNRLVARRSGHPPPGRLPFPLATTTKHNKKLIRRWDSERELFYDDIVHVLQSTAPSPKCTTRRSNSANA